MTTNSPSSNTGNPPVPPRRHRLLRVAAWMAVGLCSVLLLCAIAIAILLNSSRFHDYVIKTAQEQASASLGVPVELENYALHVSTLSLDVYGVTVHGASPYANPPLLQVDHAAVGVRIVSLLQRKWYLSDVEVDRPIVRVFTDANGVSNIPVFKSSGSSSNTSIFDLGIRHAVIDKGEAYYNDRKAALSADLHDLDLRTSFDPGPQRYSGKLSYRDGHLISGAYQPIPHNLDAEFDATPTTFHLTRAQLSSGPSQVVLTATVDNYAHPVAQGSYAISLDGAQIHQILATPSVPTGTIHASGSVAYQESANKTAIESIVVDGDLSSDRVNVQSGTMRAQVDGIAAHYGLANGDATLKDFRAALLGGEVTASGEMTAIASDTKAPHSAFKATLRGISLAAVQRTLGVSSSVKQAGVSGAVNAKADAAWGKTINDLVAHVDATIDGQAAGARPAATTAANTSAAPAAPAPISIDSVLHATYTQANQQLAVKDSYLRTPQTSLTMNGVVGNRSSLALRLQANDLAEVETIADLFIPPSPGKPVQPLGLAGSASFQGTVQGSLSAPHLQGQLTASNLAANGAHLRSFHTDVDVSPSLVSLQHADLQPASHGHVTFSASAGLSKWAFSNSSPLQIDLDATQLDIGELEQIAGQKIPVSGTLSANIHAHGTELNPVGQGNVSVTKITAYDEPVQSVQVNFSGTGEEAHADLAVALPSGSLHGKVSVRPHEKTYVAQLSAADIHLDRLASLKARNIDLKGVLSVNGSGQGSFDNPQGDLQIQIPQLIVQNQTISNIDLHANVANHVGTATLASSAVNTSIRANAKVNLTGDYMTDASLDTQSIPLQPLIAVYAPDQADKLSGETEIHATLHGPIKTPKLLEAHVTVPTLKVAYGTTIQLAAASPIHVDYKDQIVSLERASIKGTGTDLQLQGSIPTVGNGPMSLLLLGTVDLQLAQLFDPDVRSSGQVKFNINSNGPVNATDIGGQINIVDASYSSADLPVGVQHGNGVLTLTKDRLNISSFKATVGGGTLTAQGGVAYRPTLQFDLGLSAQGVRALYPVGLRESVNADIRLTGDSTNAVLGGAVNLSELSFTQAFDLDKFIGQFSGGVSSPPSAGFTQNLQLNVAVRASNDIHLASRELSVNGTANLQVRGTAAMPVILGRVNLTNGDIILNGSRFVLDGGTIEFVNPSETEPVVNISLNTTIQQYNLYLRFNGPIEQMHTSYTSDPALPAADIINLLAFGQTTESNATTSPASAIASQVSSQVTSRFSKVAGISQLSINPVLAGGSSQGPPGANVAIQQRVTGNLFVTFSSNVASTQNQTISGQYQVSPRVAVSVTRDQNGGFAFDTSIKKSW